MNSDPYRHAYRQLRAALQKRQAGRPPCPLFGLHEDAWLALVCVAWSPGSRIQLGFGERCRLPGTLRLADGAHLPVAARRCMPGRLHAWIQARNATSRSVPGTVAGLLRHREGSRLYALTAGHVLALSGTSTQGDRVLLEAPETGDSVNAQLDQWTPSLFMGRVDSRLDAGLARVTPQAAHELLDCGLPMPTGTGEIRPYDTLWLLRQGTPVPLAVRSYLTALLDLDDAGNELRLVDGLAYQAVTQPIAGDSGAPLWDGRDRLVAMHVGGDLSGGSGNGIAIRIADVLRWCGCSVVERGAPLLGSTAPLPLPGAAMPGAVPAPVPVHSASLQDLTLAQTLWGEARGEGRTGMEAVACVVLNRLRHQTYWGKNIVDVCRKPYQFSCWNAKDRNRAALARLDAGSPELAEALDIARRAIGNALSDPTGNATHYHARSVTPRWARGRAPSAVIGRHCFYNDIK